MDTLDFTDVRPQQRGLDVLERIADARGWEIHSLENGDRTMLCVGQWCSYRVHFSWHPEQQSFMIHCTMDMTLPEAKKAVAQDLVSLINDRLWIGHFSLNSKTMKPGFRHTLLMFGGDALKSLEIEEIVETALGECDRFYPAFQFSVWGDKPAEEALEYALIDCVGEA